jgi:hypothetical protein
MASAVAKTNNLIFRRAASRRTSCITGNWPYAPLPMTRESILATSFGDVRPSGWCWQQFSYICGHGSTLEAGRRCLKNEREGQGEETWPGVTPFAFGRA